MHFKAGDSAFPTHDLEFVRQLLHELTTRAYPTGSPAGPPSALIPSLAYAAGFSNGCRSNLAVAPLRTGRVLPRVRRRRQGVGPREGAALPEPADGIGGGSRVGPGGLRPRHRRPRLSAALHPGGDAVGADLAVLHGPGFVAAPTRFLPPQVAATTLVGGSTGVLKWSCSCSPGRRRSSRPRSPNRRAQLAHPHDQGQSSDRRALRRDTAPSSSSGVSAPRDCRRQAWIHRRITTAV